jgi:hypothetical protein
MEIEVTDEMTRAASAEALQHRNEPFGVYAAHLYRAMRAVAPVELISEDACRLRKERDEALAKLEISQRIGVTNAHAQAALIRERDDARAALAKFTDQAAKPTHDPFREFPSDRRRTGG